MARMLGKAALEGRPDDHGLGIISAVVARIVKYYLLLIKPVDKMREIFPGDMRDLDGFLCRSIQGKVRWNGHDVVECN
jgi:hypothetical protein